MVKIKLLENRIWEFVEGELDDPVYADPKTGEVNLTFVEEAVMEEFGLTTCREQDEVSDIVFLVADRRGLV